MKRYLLFAGMSYYAEGGWLDFKGSFDSIEDAQASIMTLNSYDIDWAHIVDTTNNKIVATSNGYYCGNVNELAALSDKAVNLNELVSLTMPT